MKSLKLLIASITILAGISACNNKEKDLRSSQFKIIKAETDDAQEESFMQSLKNANIRLYEKDMALLSDSGNYIKGQYKYSDVGKSLSMTFPGQKTINFVVDDMAGSEESKNWIVLKGSTKNGTPVKLLLEPNDYYEYEQTDQLKPVANNWRIKPAKNQSKEEIKKKVIAQLDYMIAYFNMIVQREDKIFNVKHLNAPVDFYANGLGFKDYEHLAKWRNMFYDDDDASKAPELLISAMKSMKEYPADKTSYTKGYLNTFKAMKAYLEI